MRKLFASVAIGAFLKSQLVLAANIPLLSGAATADPAQMQAVINQVIQTINANVAGAGSGSAGATMFPRNLLDNGDMWVNQRAATATCGTTTTSGLTAAAYGADRWTCDVNITSGAGQLAVTTATPTPPQGFINQSTLVRNSGALLANQCAYQVLPTSKSTAIGGTVVNFSAYVAALAGLAADNGNIANLYLITGTGTNQGLGLRGAVGMTAAVTASSFTISTSTGLITNASTVVAGEPITMTAATMPVGIVAGQTYYVSSNLLNSGTAFTVAPTYAQAIAGTGTVIPTTGGTTNVLNLNPIFPVWTGVAVYGPNNSGQGQTSSRQGWGQAQSNSFALTTSYSRLSTGPISVPTTTTEAAVAICFPPAGTTSGGSTDGIAFTGAQLEVLGTNVSSPSPYEFLNPTIETANAQRFYYQLNDQAAHTLIVPTGLATTTAACELMVQFPVTMDAVPAYSSIGTPGTGFFKILGGGNQTEATFTTLAVPATSATLASTQVGPVLASVITGTPLAAGQECALVGQGVSTTNALSWSADF